MTNKTNDRITISGSAPKFDEQVLKGRQAARYNVYDSTDECTALVRGDIPILFLNNVIDHHDKGHTLSTKYPVSIGPSGYSCRMLKPDSVRTTDRVALDAQVKQDYIVELERERDEYRVLLTAQLLQTAQLKEQKKEEERQAKLLKEIEKEVSATFGELVIPD